MMRKRDVERVRRPPARCDRPCDLCGVPMIGIMIFSGKQTPRKVCHSCGGKPTDADDRLKDAH